MQVHESLTKNVLTIVDGRLPRLDRSYDCGKCKKLMNTHF